MAGDVLAQPTANNLVEDLISNKDNIGKPSTTKNGK
jgi:hypothetical protein